MQWIALSFLAVDAALVGSHAEEVAGSQYAPKLLPMLSHLLPAKLTPAAPAMLRTPATARVSDVQMADSFFKDVAVAPPDPILSLATLYKEDSAPNKVNLGIGAYRDETGVPWVLPSVREAEMEIAKDTSLDKEYIPIDGPPALKRPVQELLFTPEALDSGRIATAQVLSGTGGLRVAADFLVKNIGTKTVYVSDPTWGNHNAIFKNSGLEVKQYRYYDAATRGFDFEGMLAAMATMEKGSIILLHACAHNPTGVDPTPEQWSAIIDACKKQGLIPMIDSAYQGYASGDLAKDGDSVKQFLDSGMEFLVTQSFAKNFGLYGERIGYLHIVASSKDRADAVLSQIKLVIRPMYSSPPRHGAFLVNRILTSPERKAMWIKDLQKMSTRIVEMRSVLRSALEEKGTPGTWNHITDQIGMFSYTGLTEAQCARLTQEYHIYLLKSGRISMAGINEGNVQYVADAIDTVVRES